jgi:hypothetical protein
MEEVVEKFVEHKWKDALDVATAECRTSRLRSSRVQGRETCNCEAGKKPWEDLELPWSKQSKERREGQFFRSLGCDKDHPAFTFELLKMQEPEAKKKALQDSGLCLFCMRHSADSECFGKGMNIDPLARFWGTRTACRKLVRSADEGSVHCKCCGYEEDDEEEEEGLVNMTEGE